MAGVCKQTAVLVVGITNIRQKKRCFNRLVAIFLTLYFTTYLSWPDLLDFYCFFTLKNVDPYDCYDACCVPLSFNYFSWNIETAKRMVYSFSASTF